MPVLSLLMLMHSIIKMLLNFDLKCTALALPPHTDYSLTVLR